MTLLKRQKLLCQDRNITNTTLQYAALDILAQGSYVRSYLCFFYLNKVIFAVLDVPSLPLRECYTSMEVFFTLISYRSVQIALSCF